MTNTFAPEGTLEGDPPLGSPAWCELMEKLQQQTEWLRAPCCCIACKREITVGEVLNHFDYFTHGTREQNDPRYPRIHYSEFVPELTTYRLARCLMPDPFSTDFFSKPPPLPPFRR